MNKGKLMEELITKINTCLKSDLTGPGYQTFLSSFTPISFENQILSIEVPNEFSKGWLKEKCEPLLRINLQETPYSNIVIRYTVSKQKQPPHDNQQLSLLKKEEKKENVIPIEFNKNYSFDNFIVGPYNRFAYAASEAVAKVPVKAYNPLFIYGSVGLGKTHLLHAIALKILKDHKHYTVKMVSSEKFTNDLINAIKDKRTSSFREKYRKVDILIIDDIQFLAGKEQTQVEFFHTFNELYANNKQIILTSDRPPKEIPTLEDRLRTRFEWGLSADIQPPEFETRIAILRKKMELNQFQISDDILHFIATQLPSNIREMEGALNRIVAYASLLQTDITLSIASNVIKDMIGIKQEKPLTSSLIKRKASEYFNISTTELDSKTRTKEVAYARQIAMYLVRELTNISLPKIGETFGNRDHTTVMHACDKIKGLLKTDSNTQSIINILIANIKNDE